MRFLLLFHIYYDGSSSPSQRLTGDASAIIETNLKNYDESFNRVADITLQEWKKRNVADQTALYKIIFHQITQIQEPKELSPG